MTVVWRSFLEIYETLKKKKTTKKPNCSELSRPAGSGRLRVRLEALGKVVATHHTRLGASC